MPRSIITMIALLRLPMPTTTKKELVDQIAEQTQAKRVTVKTVVQAFLDEIVAELVKGNRLEFREFGVFETRIRAARIGQNPKTLEQVYVPAKRTVNFKMGQIVKQKLNGPMVGRLIGIHSKEIRPKALRTWGRR